MTPSSAVGLRVGDVTLDGYTFNRNEIRICPACLIEQDRHSSAIWEKVHQLHWQIPQIEKCVLHSERLQTITEKSRTFRRIDTSLAINNAWNQIAAASAPEEPDAFDIYLTKRIYREPNNSLCDRLSIPALWRISEALGVTLTYEKSLRRSQLERPALRHALLTGFELIQAGEKALTQELIAYTNKPKNRRNGKLTPGFGELQRLLSDNRRGGKDLEPFRDFMRRYVLEHYPIHEGAIVYGQASQTRRLHTMRSAARTANVRRDVLEELLIEEGLGHLGTKGVFVLDKPLTVQLVESLRQSKKRFLYQKEAARFLGVPATVFIELQKRNVLQPSTGRDPRSHKGYDVVYLQAVLNQFFADTKAMQDVPDGLSTLALATRTARCSVSDIVQLILSGRLKAAGRLGQSLKLSNLLVSQRELLLAFPKQPRNGFTKSELARRWSKDISTINRMIEAGKLQQKRMKHSRSRMTGLLVPVDVVETYESEHLNRPARQAMR